MKKAIFLSIFIFTAICGVFSQVSTDSILMDNYFEVKFVLENADGQNFEAPDFNENFKVMSGPNFSTSMSIMNGAVSQSMTITYYLEPKDIGAYYILPASVQAEEKVLETVPLEVVVVPNPKGIKQAPPRGKMDNLQFNFGDPFDFDFSFPGLGEMPMFTFPELQQEQQPRPEEQHPPAKKKRKTTRI
jgi:hypothetical protein